VIVPDVGARAPIQIRRRVRTPALVDLDGVSPSEADRRELEDVAGGVSERPAGLGFPTRAGVLEHVEHNYPQSSFHSITDALSS